jgi:ABC-type transport system involved in multi-copper enzyme maturation permease subunit
VTSVLVLARLTLTRVLRGRAVWVSAAIASFPLLFALAMRTKRDPSGLADDLLGFVQLLMAIIPAMFVASSLGEEIEDRTTTYLWSRPLRRWHVLAGKLVALVPIVCGLCVASWVVALALAGGDPTLRGVLGIAAGAATASLAGAALSLLAPRFGMALTIAYLLFDLALGALPAALRGLALSYHTRVIAGVEPGSVPTTVVELGVVALVWGAIATWRMNRLEA